MTNWIIASKLKAPLRHAREVPREALLCCLDDVLNAKVTLIHAPAGYGKTTCLGMFQKRMYDQGTVTAWLTLDTYDSGLFQFLHYLMESGQPDFYRPMTSLTSPGNPPSPANQRSVAP